LEAEFAAFAGAERALFFNSGFAANTGLSALPGPGYVIFPDALNHASIIDSIRLSRARKVIYPHGEPACGRILVCPLDSEKPTRRACSAAVPANLELHQIKFDGFHYLSVIQVLPQRVVVQDFRRPIETPETT
jgi:hypothetical protein